LSTTFKIIEALPEGYAEGIYLKRKYAIVKKTFNAGKSFKVYANELGGNNFISLNYYHTRKEEILRPCEMSSEKVIHFLQEVRLLNRFNHQMR